MKTEFVMNREWLHQYYGSHGNGQVLDAIAWLTKYGREGVGAAEIERWKNWKHLTEYHSNTWDIVDQCLEACDKRRVFKSELDAHRFVNLLRVPAASAYEEALAAVKPNSILELGVGGDSAISTAVFLAYLDGVKSKDKALVSVDHNPLGMTLKRYTNVPWWTFLQEKSVGVLERLIGDGRKFDMVFIDTDHSYATTKRELELAMQISDAVLMDDATFPGNSVDKEPGGVKRAIEEMRTPTWGLQSYWGGNVAMFTKRRKVLAKRDE